MSSTILIILLSALARIWPFIFSVVIVGTIGEGLGYPTAGFLLGAAIGFTITYTRGVLGK